MKWLFSICLFTFLVTGCSSVKTDKDRIVQQRNPKADKEIVLVKIISDSRCPEGVDCVWRGEVTFEVVAYENNKQVEQNVFTLNATTEEEIKRWFVQHLPESKEILKGVQVLPYPKDGVRRSPEEYYIKLVY